MTSDQANRLVSVPATTAAGNYRVQAGGSVGGIDRGFSANIPLTATELSRLKPEALEALLGKGRFHLAHSREEIDRNVSAGRVGRELYPLLIVLVALALGLEYLLANRFYRRTDSPEPRRWAANSAPASDNIAAPPIVPPPPYAPASVPANSPTATTS